MIFFHSTKFEPRAATRPNYVATIESLSHWSWRAVSLSLRWTRSDWRPDWRVLEGPAGVCLLYPLALALTFSHFFPLHTRASPSRLSAYVVNKTLFTQPYSASNQNREHYNLYSELTFNSTAFHPSCDFISERGKSWDYLTLILSYFFFLQLHFVAFVCVERNIWIIWHFCSGGQFLFSL